MPVFISEVKKENSTKKKNEHGDICFLINYKLLCKLSFLFVSVVTLYDIFYSRFKRFLALMFFHKIDFSLKISYVPFLLFFCVLL